MERQTLHEQARQRASSRQSALHTPEHVQTARERRLDLLAQGRRERGDRGDRGVRDVRAARERGEERLGQPRRELVLDDSRADGNAPDLREGAQEDVQRERGRVLLDGERREHGEVRRAVDRADADAGQDLEPDRRRFGARGGQRGEQALSDEKQDPAEPDRGTVSLGGGDHSPGDDCGGCNCECNTEDERACADGRGESAGLVVDREIIHKPCERDGEEAGLNETEKGFNDQCARIGKGPTH